jgi:hypothetical protein
MKKNLIRVLLLVVCVCAFSPIWPKRVIHQEVGPYDYTIGAPRFTSHETTCYTWLWNIRTEYDPPFIVWSGPIKG